MSNKMSSLLLLPFIISVCYSFLLENTSPIPNSEFLMTDKQYYTLLDMITQLQGQLTEEILYRRHLQQSVTQLQTELAQSKAEYAQQIVELKNKSDLIERGYKEIKTDCVNAQNKIFQLENELLSAVNKTDNLNQDIQSTNSKVDILMSERTARINDVLVLYNKTLTFESSIETNFQTLNNSFIIQYANLETKLENKIAQIGSHQSLTDAKLSLAVKQIEKVNENVAMTACSDHHTYPNVSDIIKFPDVRSSVGINKGNPFWSTGKFACEKPGLYMFAANIMSSTNLSEYQFYKNGSYFTRIFIKPSLSTPDFYTASGVVAVELDVNDTVHVGIFQAHMELYGLQFSCLTVIKIK